MDEQTFNQQGRWTAIALLAACLATGGCATMMKGAIPASQLPPELMVEAHCPRTPIDFTLLRQPPPPSYLVGPRDVLGIYIQDILGRNDQPPPVFSLILPANSSDPQLAVGNPVTVADDGTIILPHIPPLRVAGLTIPQIDAAIHRAYTVDTRILQQGQEVITVTLIHRRLHRVLVIREDSPAVPPILKPRDGTVISRRGTTTTIDLPRFENDVLHALSQTGGLPGEDARNEIWVLRGRRQRRHADHRAVARRSGSNGIGHQWRQRHRADPLVGGSRHPLPFGPSDIVLNDGDVVYRAEQGRAIVLHGRAAAWRAIPAAARLRPRHHQRDLSGGSRAARVRPDFP